MSPTYVIEKMDRHKGGVYICTANNGVGHIAISQINLHVLCKSLLFLSSSLRAFVCWLIPVYEDLHIFIYSSLLLDYILRTYMPPTLRIDGVGGGTGIFNCSS